MEPIRHYYMNAAELMDEVLDVYKKSFFKQLAFSIIVQIISSVIIFVVAFVGILAFMITFFSAAANDPSFFAVAVMIAIGAGILILFICLSSALSSTGSIIIAKEAFTGENTSLGTIIGIAFKKMLPVATVVFAEVLLMIPIILLWVGVFIAYFFMASSTVYMAESVSIPIILIGGFFIVLFILATLVIFQALTIIAAPVAIFEKKYFFAAVGKGFQLIQKDFWRILGIVAIWFIVVEVISYGIFAVTNLGGVLVNFVVPRDIAEFLTLISTGTNYVFSAVVGVVLAPLGGIFATMMYINQKMKYEGYDMELDIELLERRQHQAQTPVPPHFQYRS